MTARARVVLSDCEAALGLLHDCEFGQQWRQRWVTVIALLRAVGHVLRNVDGKSDPGLGRAVRLMFEELETTKPKPELYWQFIVQERNNILKEYKFSGAHASASSSASFTSLTVSVPGGPSATVSKSPPGPPQVHIQGGYWRQVTYRLCPRPYWRVPASRTRPTFEMYTYHQMCIFIHSILRHNVRT